VYSRSLVKNILFLFCIFSADVFSMDKGCIAELKKFEVEYKYNEGVSNVQRLNYLESIKNICRNNAIHSVFQSKTLLKMKRVDEAFLLLDDSIANYSQPIGDLLYEKAVLMQRMVFAGFKSKTEYSLSYEEATLLFKQALKTSTNMKPLIYLGLAEVNIQINELDRAIENLDNGINLDSNIARLYSLRGIIESKKGNFENAQEYLGMSVNIQGMKYLKEPDTVLALAKVFCHAKRKDLVIDLVIKAREITPHSDDFSDLQEAYDIAKNCPHPNPLG